MCTSVFMEQSTATSTPDDSGPIFDETHDEWLDRQEMMENEEESMAFDHKITCIVAASLCLYVELMFIYFVWHWIALFNGFFSYTLTIYFLILATILILFFYFDSWVPEDKFIKCKTKFSYRASRLVDFNYQAIVYFEKKMGWSINQNPHY